ncbi:MAG TPA: CoA pyrophosphatase [Bryobacteraceae bacterium]|jgi:8-oxo-dGTP pyrophosphatase MutT (NUDIX family)|nr:CoA pyrophosphatase [Bryobacteraceae bacterium]
MRMTEPEAAVAMVQAHGQRKSILLIRRAEREGDSWSGHWSFPGGWRHAADRDLLCTAIRELEEECGVRLAREQMDRALPHTLARRKVGRFVLVAPFVFRVEREFATVLNPGEAVEALWVPVSLLVDPARHSLRPVPGRPPEMLFPAVDLNGLPLWGFTYRLITDWLSLGPKHQPVELAGFEAAGLVLEFLLGQGLKSSVGWTDQPEGMKAAKVVGVIPVDAVLAHFVKPEHYSPAINCLEVRAEYVRVAGPAWEEYFIYAS